MIHLITLLMFSDPGLKLPDPYQGRNIFVTSREFKIDNHKILLSDKAGFGTEYSRYYWISKDELLLSINSRFYRVSLKDRKVRLSGSGLLAFYMNNHTGYISLDPKRLYWNNKILFETGIDQRIIGVSSTGTHMLLESDSIRDNYQVFSISDSRNAIKKAQWTVKWSDEWLGLIEPIGSRKFVWSPADGRGIQAMMISTPVPDGIVTQPKGYQKSDYQWYPTQFNGRVIIQYFENSTTNTKSIKVR